MLGRTSTAALVGFMSGLAHAQTGNLLDLGTILSQSPNLTTYYGLIQKFPNILLELPNYAGVTIIAPENAAFDKYQGWDSTNETLVTNTLEYHVLQGTIPNGNVAVGIPQFQPTLLKSTAYTNVTGGQRLEINKQPGNVVIYTSGLGSRSTVVSGDTVFSGGLLQTVDSLLVPPQRIEPTMHDAYQDLQSFLGALYQTGLVSEFATDKNVTIFAPHNAAFQEVAGTLAGLSNDDLKQVLAYHVVPNQVIYSTSLDNATSYQTSATDRNGTPLKVGVTQSGNNRYVDAAQLLQLDILVANGVVHIIDNVLNPNQPDLRALPSLGTQAPAYVQTGATSTGTAVAVPYTTAFPCTTDGCPVSTTSTATATKSTSTKVTSASSQGGGVAAMARCTGLAGAMGAFGVGVLGVAAVL